MNKKDFFKIWRRTLIFPKVYWGKLNIAINKLTAVNEVNMKTLTILSVLLR